MDDWEREAIRALRDRVTELENANRFLFKENERLRLMTLEATDPVLFRKVREYKELDNQTGASL